MRNPSMTPLAIGPPKAGEMVALAVDLYWMRFTLPFRLNHINLYAFDTKDGWLLLDCGIQSQAIADQWQVMLAGPLAGQPQHSGTEYDLRTTLASRCPAKWMQFEWCVCCRGSTQMQPTPWALRAVFAHTNTPPRRMVATCRKHSSI